MLRMQTIVEEGSKVSVIVPVYLVEEYIQGCAESLFRQDWKNLEIIFVDNLSPDASIDLVKASLENYPERKADTLFVTEPRRGLGFAREAGLAAATGDYIIHVDSDDWVEPDFISAMVARSVEEDADVVYCDYYKEYCSGKPSKHHVERDLADPDSVEERLFAIHNTLLQAYMWNKLIRRSVYDQAALVIPIRNMHEDIVFQTQLLYRARRMVHLKRPLYHYRRRRRGAITAGSWSKTRRSSAEGLFYLYESLPATGGPLDYCRQDLVMRASWYAVSTFQFSILEDHPSVFEVLATMPIVKGRRVPPVKQRILKLYSRIRLKCSKS